MALYGMREWVMTLYGIRAANDLIWNEGVVVL